MRFVVNEEKGIVVAIMDSVHNRLHKAVIKACPFILMRASGMDKFIKRFPDTYRGIAKCSPEDKWDEKIGRYLADARAQLSYRLAEAKVLQALEDKLSYAEFEASVGSIRSNDIAENLACHAYPGGCIII